METHRRKDRVDLRKYRNVEEIPNVPPTEFFLQERNYEIHQRTTITEKS